MLTEREINDIKTSSFPNIYLKKAILTETPTKNICKLHFYISEDYFGEKKIFKNVNKDKIKLKIFAYNKSIKNENIKNSIELNAYLIENQFPSLELYPCVDYSGGSAATVDDLRKGNNIILSYRTDIVIDKKIDINNLNIGFLLFHDHMEYSKEFNIDINSINVDLLSGVINEYVLIQEGKNVDTQILSDLKNIKKIFSQREALNNLIDSLNIQRLSKKNLSQTQKSLEVKKYFSEALFSTSENGYLNFVFNFDYAKFAEDNSSIPRTIDSRFRSLISETNAQISSINILRKAYRKGNSKEEINVKNLFEIKNSQINLVSSKDKKTVNELIDGVNVDKNTDNVIATIKQIDLFDSYKTFNATDLTAYLANNIILSYGVKITVTDTYYLFIKTLSEKLSENIKNLKAYLGECLNPLNYDASSETFSQSFIDGKFENDYKTNIEDCVKDFVSTVKILGLLDDKEESDTDYANELISLVIPKTTFQQLLTYFVSFYERFVKLLNETILRNSNSNIEIEHWFKKENDLIDTTKRPGYGYGYLTRCKDVDSISEIDSSMLNYKVTADIQSYSAGINTIEEYCLSPSYIISQYDKILLDTFNADTKQYTSLKNNISDNFYVNLETEIKRYNSIDTTAEYIPPSPYIKFSNKSNNTFNSTKLDKPLKIKDLYDKQKTLRAQKVIFDINYDNYVKQIVKPINYADNTRAFATQTISNVEFANNIKHTDFTNSSYQETTQINKNINPEEIMMALMKMSTQKQTINNTSQKPFHINALLDNKTTFFSSLQGDKPYLKDMVANSKFLFLFNTICKIEYSKVDTSTNSFTWNVLKVTDINESNPAKMLCRLNLYQNSDDNIDGFNQIKMPIYDKYFILINGASPLQIQESPLKVTYDTQTFVEQEKKPTKSIEKTKIIKALKNRYETPAKIDFEKLVIAPPQILPPAPQQNKFEINTPMSNIRQANFPIRVTRKNRG